MPEGEVGGDEEPPPPAARHDGADRAARQRVVVIGPVHAIGRAARPGQVRGPGRHHHVDLLLLPRQVLHRQRHGRIAQAEDGVHTFLVVPAPCDRHADIGAVLQVAEHQLDRHAIHAPAEILDGEARGDHIPHALLVGKHAGHVVQHADLDHAVRDAGLGTPFGRADGGERQARRRRRAGCLRFMIASSGWSFLMGIMPCAARRRTGGVSAHGEARRAEAHMALPRRSGRQGTSAAPSRSMVRVS